MLGDGGACCIYGRFATEGSIREGAGFDLNGLGALRLKVIEEKALFNLSKGCDGKAGTVPRCQLMFNF